MAGFLSPSTCATVDRPDGTYPNISHTFVLGFGRGFAGSGFSDLDAWDRLSDVWVMDFEVEAGGSTAMSSPIYTPLPNNITANPNTDIRMRNVSVSYGVDGVWCPGERSSPNFAIVGNSVYLFGGSYIGMEYTYGVQRNDLWRLDVEEGDSVLCPVSLPLVEDGSIGARVASWVVFLFSVLLMAL